MDIKQIKTMWEKSIRRYRLHLLYETSKRVQDLIDLHFDEIVRTSDPYYEEYSIIACSENGKYEILFDYTDFEEEDELRFYIQTYAKRENETDNNNFTTFSDYFGIEENTANQILSDFGQKLMHILKHSKTEENEM